MRSFGGAAAVTLEMQQRCLKRLQAWTLRAKAVVSAEFPEFEAMAAFQVLSLAEVRSRHLVIDGSDDTDATKTRRIDRLSILFDLDKQKLEEQLNDHRHIALKHYTDNKSTTSAAWEFAIEQTQRHPTSRARHSVSELRVLLEGYKTFGGSTSGIEHNFATVLRTISAQQTSANKDHEETLFKIAVDRKSFNENDVIEQARKLWVGQLGTSRKRASDRIDKGSTKKKTIDLNTEIGFLRKRRSEVARNASKVGPA